MKKNIIIKLSILMIISGITSCTTDEVSLSNNETTSTYVQGNITNWLSTREDDFSLLLDLISKAGYEDKINAQEVTFFASTNTSIKLFIEEQGLVSIQQVSSEEATKLLDLYILSEKVITMDNIIELKEYFLPNGNSATIEVKRGSFKGNSTLGYPYIHYSVSGLDVDGSVDVVTSDIQFTNSGVVQVLDSEHTFGFTN